MNRRETLKALAALPLIGAAFRDAAAGPRVVQLREGVSFIEHASAIYSSASTFDLESGNQMVFFAGDGAQWWNVPGGICCRTEHLAATKAMVERSLEHRRTAKPPSPTITARCRCGKQFEIARPSFGSTWTAVCDDCSALADLEKG